MSINTVDPAIGSNGSHQSPSLRFAYLATAAMAILTALAALAINPRDHEISLIFFLQQDVFVVAAGVLVFGFTAFATRWPAPSLPNVTTRNICLAAAAMLIVAMVGHLFIMRGFAFSRDEQMVLFDAEVFSGLQLVASIPEKWRQLLDLMNHTFLIITPDGTGWISAYLPVNGMFHALAFDFGLAFMVNPLLAVIGLFATWRIARRLWPESSETVAVAVLLYLTSTQVLAMSMTSYAMTGHLALNMVWLMLFLEGRWRSHAAAIVVGFLACGLHQVIFHPLFVLPFLVLLMHQRKWRTVIAYGVSYALIGLFWISYAKLAVASGAVAEGLQVSGMAGYAERVWSLIRQAPPDNFALMAANIVRFFAWQNLILLPLLVIAVISVRRSQSPLYLAMLASVLLTPLVVCILLAFQGHGWGYRYMHGLIGIACLVGALGWHQLRERGLCTIHAVWIPTMATVFLIAPFLLWTARELTSKYAVADQYISQLDVDVVLIDDTASRLAIDLAINRPQVTNRPVRLVASKVDAARRAELCRRYSVLEVINIGRKPKPMSTPVCN